MNGEARIWVRDSGPGIAPEDQARDLRAVRPGPVERQRSDGSGLGLAIVRAIAEAHGGRIELESQPGHGARLTIASAHPRRETRTMARILIAEDEARIASFVDKGLRANGFTTLIVGDGHGAAAAARDADFDLLILDLGLPGRDGLDVLGRSASGVSGCPW